MEKAILDFNKQFGWQPEIVNVEKLPVKSRFVVAGMGGSHLSADILKEGNPFADILVWESYGLPPLAKDRMKEYLYVASSYSGNTEETISFAETAFENGHALACITVGGKLLNFAKENGIPYVQLPDTGIQPRSALGFSILAMAKILRLDECFSELSALREILKPDELRAEGRAIAESLKGKVPVIYSSLVHKSIAYNWKIKFNETAKIPAFCNMFPELNHNEMTGFDAKGDTGNLSKHFHFVFLNDSADHPQVRKRMKVTEKLYEDRGLPVTTLWLDGAGKYEKTFRSLLIADWTAFELSLIYGTEAEKVPMVEEFKKLITE
ncbi:MAG: SIS domain-containing protein [bacterium]|nr:SIS domain-containing protein [bacterium]